MREDTDKQRRRQTTERRRWHTHVLLGDFVRRQQPGLRARVKDGVGVVSCCGDGVAHAALEAVEAVKRCQHARANESIALRLHQRGLAERHVQSIVLYQCHWRWECRRRCHCTLRERLLHERSLSRLLHLRPRLPQQRPNLRVFALQACGGATVASSASSVGADNGSLSLSLSVSVCVSTLSLPSLFAPSATRRYT